MVNKPHPTGNRIGICYNTKTVYLTDRHLNPRPANYLYNNFYTAYSIFYKYINANTRKHLKKLIKRGFKVVFEYNQTSVLLIYPKKSPCLKNVSN